MKTIVILADGITPFTSLRALHTLYGKLWDAGIPVAFGVIPAVRGDVYLDATGKMPLPTIPAEKRDAAGPFRIADNKHLCDYLNAMAQQRLVEICQQGYNGIYGEFASEDDVLLSQKIDEGRADLQRAMPDAQLQTFIAPQGTVSETATSLLMQYDLHLCSHTTANALSMQSSLPNNRALYHYGAPILPYTAFSDDSFAEAKERITAHPFVLLRFPVWMITAPQATLDAWNTLVDYILQLDDVFIDTFMFVEQD